MKEGNLMVLFFANYAYLTGLLVVAILSIAFSIPEKHADVNIIKEKKTTAKKYSAKRKSKMYHANTSYTHKEKEIKTISFNPIYLLKVGFTNLLPSHKENDVVSNNDEEIISAVEYEEEEEVYDLSPIVTEEIIEDDDSGIMVTNDCVREILDAIGKNKITPTVIEGKIKDVL